MEVDQHALVYPDWPGGSSMSMAVGIYVDPLNLRPEDVNILHISRGLAHTSRYNGHTAWPYSVAQHSIYVAHAVMRQTKDPRKALAGLLHDASEAYLGDMIRPLKSRFPEFKEIEDRVQRTIAERFNLDWPFPPEVHEWDERMIMIEAVCFRDFAEGVWAPSTARQEFLRRFNRYVAEIGLPELEQG